MQKDILASSKVEGLNPVVLIAIHNDNSITEYLVQYGRNKIQTRFMEQAKKQYFIYVQQQMNDKLF